MLYDLLEIFIFHLLSGKGKLYDGKGFILFMDISHALVLGYW